MLRRCLLATLLAGCTAPQPLTTPAPEWLADCIASAIKGGWRANDPRDEEKKGFRAYGLQWFESVHAHTMRGELWAASQFDMRWALKVCEFRVFWDAAAGVTRVYQFGPNDSLERGTLEQLEDGTLRFELPVRTKEDGVVQIRGTIRTLGPDRVRTEVRRVDEDGRRIVRSHTWKRVK